MPIIERAPCISRPAHPIRAGMALPRDAFSRVRAAMLLEHCKWDPQVGDVATLASFPLLMSDARWNELRNLAEHLAAETSAAERELQTRPDLHRILAVPSRLRAILRSTLRCGATPAAARVMRFDFHWTRDGWRISEVNSDVPGGFAEGSEFPALIARHYPGAQPAGDPAGAWTQAIIKAVGSNPNVAMIRAAGYMEDHQVMAYLGRRLADAGLSPRPCTPEQIEWRDGIARLRGGGPPFGTLVRFFQAEWFARVPARYWRGYFAGGRTPGVNPGCAILTESKRFPLVWDDLDCAMPTWRRLLPETRDPRCAPWRRNGDWLLKAAFCNTGDAICARDWTSERQWKLVQRQVRWRPAGWIAQRRFQTIPIDSPLGAVYPCIGVFTADGRAIGAYARLSAGPVVDYRAIDAALLVERSQDLEES